jgi:Ca2+/H+ antiporter
MQSFNPLGASTFSALLLLSCIGMVIPAVFQDILPPEEANQV